MYKSVYTLKVRTGLQLPVVLKFERAEAFLVILMYCVIEKLENFVSP